MRKIYTVGAFILVFILNISSLQFTTGRTKSGLKNNELKNLHLELSKVKNDTTRIKILIDLCWYHMTINTDSAILYAKMALKIARTTNNMDMVYVASALGDAYNIAGDYENALKFDFEAFNNAQKINDTKKYSIIFNNIGSNYIMLNDHAKGLEYFNKALEISKDYDSKFLSLTNLAQVFGGKNEFAKAHEFYEKALKLAESEKNITDKACVYNRLGDLYLMEANYTKSSLYFEKSLEILDVNNSYMIVDCLRGITDVYLRTKHYEKGIKTALRADSLAQAGEFINEAQDINSLLSELYDSVRKPALALAYYKKYSAYKDSIFNKEKNKRISFLQAEFETKQRELQVENLQEEAAFHRKMSYVYLCIGLLVFTILIYLIKDIVQKNKKLKIEKALSDQRFRNEQEKLRIEKERIKQQQEKEKLEKQRLEMELDAKHREILTNAIQINQQKEVLTAVSSELVNIVNTEDSYQIINSVKQLNADIKNRIDLSDDWVQIKLHFEKVHPEFFNHLKNDFPDLTMHELKLCAYTKLKFNGKEIGRLLNITSRSVQMLRYRLKKKMNIPEEDSLIDILAGRE